MAERMSAYISIGGSLARTRVPKLLKAINAADVTLEWGDACFQPKTAEDLLSSLHDASLWLCDDQASYGEFAELEQTCRTLGLSYTRYSEGKHECDPEVVDWRPGMSVVLTRMGSNYSERTYVSTEEVEKVLKHLEAGRVARATKVLKRLCPRVPELPRFEII